MGRLHLRLGVALHQGRGSRWWGSWPAPWLAEEGQSSALSGACQEGSPGLTSFSMEFAQYCLGDAVLCLLFFLKSFVTDGFIHILFSATNSIGAKFPDFCSEQECAIAFCSFVCFKLCWHSWSLDNSREPFLIFFFLNASSNTECGSRTVHIEIWRRKKSLAFRWKWIAPVQARHHLLGSFKGK